MTLPLSFHISVTRVSPGNTTPAKRTLMSLYGPNVFRMCFPEMPNEHRPTNHAFSRRSLRMAVWHTLTVKNRLIEAPYGGELRLNL